MPRAKSITRDEIAARALRQFWRAGYEATSIGQLVAATGASRAAIYSDFGDKRGLFLACFAYYRQEVVSPAFAPVERKGAGLADIRRYFERQIALADSMGLPGPGCFVGNSATEVAPSDRAVRAEVERHDKRLTDGFANALPATCRDIAKATAVFATGLWALSRTVRDSDALRDAADSYLTLIEGNCA